MWSARPVGATILWYFSIMLKTNTSFSVFMGAVGLAKGKIQLLPNFLFEINQSAFYAHLYVLNVCKACKGQDADTADLKSGSTL